MHEAKTHLSRLIEQVEAGEEVIIAKAGKPVARLVAFRSAPPEKRQGGFWKGMLHLSPDWDSAEVNREVAKLFEGGAEGGGDDPPTR